MISPEEGPGCQGLHYIFNYKDIHMVTLQYVQWLRASKPYCNASRAFDVLANPFLDTGLSLGSHTGYVLGMATRYSLQENCWELQHKPLWSFGPPNFFNSLLGCEDEFKSALQPINGLRNQQYYG